MPRRKGTCLTRQDVVEAAISCLQQEGEESLGVNRGARELGIQPPSLYNHVAGNGDLRQAVALEGLKRLMTHLRQHTNGIPDRQDRVRALAHAYRDFAHAHEALYAVLSTVSFDPTDPYYQPAIQDWMSFYDDRLKPFGLQGDAVVHGARFLLSTLHGFVQMERSGKFRLEQPRDQSYVWIIQALIDALEASGSSSEQDSET